MALVSLLCLLLILPACSEEAGTPPPAETNYTAENIAAAVIMSQEHMPPLVAVEEDEEFEYYKSLYLGDLSSEAEGGVICFPFGPEASEVTVFLMSSPEAAESAAEPLRQYTVTRAGAFQGYAPQEAELAGEGVVLTRGAFAAVVICEDTEAAEAAFDACFGDDAPEPPELAPLLAVDGSWLIDDPGGDDTDDPGGDNTDEPDDPEGPDVPEGPEGPGGDDPDPAVDVYDHDAVLAAFETGDSSGLSPKNLAILEACRTAIDSVIAEGMTDYEKELAIHNYMINAADYDEAELSHAAAGLIPDPDNDNPYGFLLHGKGICLGYTNTFQLFMDMLGVECLTVHGFAYDWTEDHAWNMVCLDGEWYCVDVTWDDPVSNLDSNDERMFYYTRKYFNVTSEFMRDWDHQWLEEVPEATATKYSWDSMN